MGAELEIQLSKRIVALLAGKNLTCLWKTPLKCLLPVMSEHMKTGGLDYLVYFKCAYLLVILKSVFSCQINVKGLKALLFTSFSHHMLNCITISAFLINFNPSIMEFKLVSSFIIAQPKTETENDSYYAEYYFQLIYYNSARIPNLTSLFLRLVRSR